LLPPQLVQGGIVFYRLLDDLDAIAGVVGQLCDDGLDDLQCRWAQVTAWLADDRDRRHAEGTSTALPAAIHSPVPPSTLVASNPRDSSACATRAERPPDWQITSNASDGSSSRRSPISDIGMFTAPGTCPDANSSRSRTSMSGVLSRAARSAMVIDFMASSGLRRSGSQAKQAAQTRSAPGDRMLTVSEHDEQVGGARCLGRLLLVATLVASLAKQLAVLLLRHALAALL